MELSVLVPTFQRPADLARCLGALAKQTRAPDEVILVVRPDDAASLAVLSNHESQIPLRRIFVTVPGQVAALDKGFAVMQGDVVAITDDDAAPRPDWLERIEKHFRGDQTIGGLGGRDFLHENGRMIDGGRAKVGLIQWFGRTIGNHHLGVGLPRDVDFLKGANMSYRREAIAGLVPDKRLRGEGAQPANDWSLSLSVRRRGWRVVYDPAVAVDHYPSVRHDNDQRDQFHWQARANFVHNETLVLLDHLPPFRRYVLMVWALVVGHRYAPGLVQWARFAVRRDKEISVKLSASIHGRLEGWRTWRRSAPIPPAPPSGTRTSNQTVG